MSPDPNIATLFVVTASAGGLMTLAGLAKNALDRRRNVCPTCGRLVERRCYTCR
jgi:hypothetical protein